jgi:hypothetical protein
MSMYLSYSVSSNLSEEAMLSQDIIVIKNKQSLFLMFQKRFIKIKKTKLYLCNNIIV